jgi:hypothetical protein
VTDLDNEFWLRQRMLDHRGPDVFDGSTDPNIRKQRFREAIKQCGIECVVIGSKKGKPVNWREAFQQLYNETL